MRQQAGPAHHALQAAIVAEQVSMLLCNAHDVLVRWQAMLTSITDIVSRDIIPRSMCRCGVSCSAVLHIETCFTVVADADADAAVQPCCCRYILWEAEDQGLELPWACRMGCCTACAVRVKEGSVYQPEALGVSEELKKQGYALMCVSFPDADCVLETVPRDEVYDLQFGRSFAAQALNPSALLSNRDDFALEIAQMDE